MIKLTLYKRTSIPYILSLATLLTGSSLVSTKAGDFESWWDGKGLLRGNGDTTQRIGQDSNIIFDTRSNLEDQGVKFTGKYKAAFYGVTSSSLGSRGFWCDQLDLGIELNPSRIFKLESLDGVKLFAYVRYRDSFEDSRPNLIVESNSMFNPNHMDSGAQWRFNSFGFEYSTKELFPIKDLFTLRGGWLQPSREFLDQPLSKLFLNNAIESSKGLGGNIKWSSSTTTWGGTLNFKPTDWFYVKNGFFLYWPNVSSKNNRALGFLGDDYVTSKNGGMYVAEVGVTPKITADKLEGKYAFGLHVTEVQGAKDANNTLIDSQHGFWIQADQMLWREPSEEAGKLKKEGLSTFNVVSWAEADNRSNVFPLYFHSGLAYTGLLPSRDKDILAIAFAYGYYNTSGSASFQTYRPYTYTSVIEATYQYKINGWSHLQPFVQIIDNPKGNSMISNATIIGFQVGMTF